MGSLKRFQGTGEMRFDVGKVRRQLRSGWLTKPPAHKSLARAVDAVADLGPAAARDLARLGPTHPASSGDMS